MMQEKIEMLWKKLKPYVWFSFLVAIGLEVYLEIARLWDYGGYGGHQHIWVTEYLVLLPIAFLFYDKQHPGRSLLDFMVFIIPIYLSYDVFYNGFLRAPIYPDVRNIKDLFSVFPVMTTVLILFIIVWLSYIVKRVLNTFSKWKLIAVVMMPLAAWLALNNFQYVSWIKDKNWVVNGRVLDTIYENLHFSSISRKLNTISLSDCPKFFKSIKLNKKPNITFVLLESWAAAEAFSDVPYSLQQLAPSLSSLLASKHGKFSWVVVPTFGGGTAKSEFELLTGYPNAKEYGAVVFNDLSGGPIDSFVRMLHQNGYQVKGYIATNPFYFNAPLAYPSIGFDLKKVSFLKQDHFFMEKWYTKGDENIFDGDLFRYFISVYQEKNSVPQFNYLLGMYGHAPFYRNVRVRPDKFFHKNDMIKRWINSYYYRNEALAKFLKSYTEKHPNDILFVVGDHLPPYVVSEKNKYQKESVYIQHALFYDRGTWRVLPEHLPLYAVSRYITRVLSDKDIPLTASPEQALKQTMCRIKESMQGQDWLN